MKLLGSVFVGVAVTISGLVWSTDGLFLPNPLFQSHISQAWAAETIQTSPTAGFSQKPPSRSYYRYLIDMFRREPWRLRGTAREFSPSHLPLPASTTDRFPAPVAIQDVVSPPHRFGVLATADSRTNTIAAHT